MRLAIVYQRREEEEEREREKNQHTHNKRHSLAIKYVLIFFCLNASERIMMSHCLAVHLICLRVYAQPLMVNSI